MTEFRRFPKTDARQIIDYNRFLSLTGEKVFICLDRGVMEVARYFLNSRAGWPTSYAVSYQDIGYTIPTEEQMEPIRQAIAEANLDMSNCEELNTTLQEILGALQGISAGIVNSAGCGPCGGGSRGAGSTEEPYNPYDQDATPTTPPPGFSDMEEFESHKCNAAYDLITNLKNDLQGITAIDYVTSGYNEIIIAVVAVLLTPIPYDDIALLVGLLIYAGISYSFLSEISSDIFDDSDNLACILYSSPDAATAQTEFRVGVQALIQANGWAENVEQFVTSAIDHMTPSDSFNKLFEPGPTITQDGDCSACEGSAIWAINPAFCTPTIDSGDFSEGTPTVVQSCEGNYFGTTRAGHNTGSNPTSTENRRVQITAVTGGGNFFVILVDAGTPDGGNSYSAAALATLDDEISGIQITRLDASDTTPFTIEYVVEAL